MVVNLLLSSNDMAMLIFWGFGWLVKDSSDCFIKNSLEAFLCQCWTFQILDSTNISGHWQTLWICDRYTSLVVKLFDGVLLVSLTNILHVTFLFNSALRSFSPVTFWLCHFFGAKILAQKLSVKSWWNWLLNLNF